MKAGTICPVSYFVVCILFFVISFFPLHNHAVPANIVKYIIN